MSIQECALYGDLVLYLRDRAAELLAGEEGDARIEQEQLDEIIRDWFFTPQERLHGCAPRDLIWAEQKGELNPIHPDYLDGFFDDDCPICQAEHREVEEALDAGEEHGWRWFYDDGGYPLIARYDPEGWDEHWGEDLDDFGMAQEEELEELDDSFDAMPIYDPPPFDVSNVSPEEFIERMRHPWLDPALHEAAWMLADRVDCLEPGIKSPRYRRITFDEAISLVIGLYEQGVDVEMLLAQIDAFPYENIALDWMSYPEQNAAIMIEAMEKEIPADDEGEQARFRHHRDFIFALAEVIHPGARLWLQGWLDAVAYGVFAYEARTASED